MIIAIGTSQTDNNKSVNPIEGGDAGAAPAPNRGKPSRANAKNVNGNEKSAMIAIPSTMLNEPRTSRRTRDDVIRASLEE